MDFDEYEYLERAVEVSEPDKESNGVMEAGVLNRKGDDQDGSNRKATSRSDVHDRPNAQEMYDRPERRVRVDRDRRNYPEEKDLDRPERKGERVHDRDRGHDRERYERPFRGGFRGRDRRIDRSYRHMDRDFDRDRDGRRHRDKPYGRNKDFEPDFDKERRESRSNREKKEKKEEADAEPEADPERDQRTVFAFQISLKADERDVYEFFSRAGKVRDVRLIMDRNTRRSKGVGYIEFYDAMSVPMAIALTGQLLLGQPVMVKPSEAEKNLVQSTASGATGPGSGNARRLYVGNLHYNITEDQLRQVFEPFGPVDLVQLPPDPETGLSKGYGFVQYVKLEDARSAQQALNGVLELAGRVMKVMLVTDQAGMQEVGVTPGELDDDDGGGLSLTAQSRAALMQKLDRSGTVSSVNASISASLSLGHNVLPGPPSAQSSLLGQVGAIGMHNSVITATTTGGTAGVIGVPTDCLQLKNMFDPTTETDPDFDLDIKDEVQSECGKFGDVKHIFVDKNSAGHVYIRFDSVSATINAQRALHGRWFAGKMLTATFIASQEYESKFPDSV